VPLVSVEASLVGGSSVTSGASLALPLGSTLPGSSDFVSASLVTRGVVASLSGGSTFSASSLLSILTVSLGGGATFSPTATATFVARATVSGGAALTAAIGVVVGPVAPVRYIPSRQAPSSRMVFDQVDLFLVDGKTRAQDVRITDLYLRVYYNGVQLPWVLASGAGIPDVRVAAGKVYWTEFSAGFYSIRFFPNAVGIWRVLVTYPTYDQAVSLTYDVAPQDSAAGSVGLRASFLRP